MRRASPPVERIACWGLCGDAQALSAFWDAASGCVRPSYLRRSDLASFQVNGKAQRFDGDAKTPLFWYLRDELGLLGTKFGCGMALCGACAMHLDGAAGRSCITPVSAAEGKHITTIEGLNLEGNHPVQ